MTADMVRERLTAAGLRVHPLEWRRFPEDGSQCFEGQTERREFIERALTLWGAIFLMVKDGVYSLESRPTAISRQFETAAAARAAAEAEYEQSILSALALSNSTGEAE